MNKKVFILLTMLSLSIPLMSMEDTKAEGAKKVCEVVVMKLKENSEQVAEAARRLSESGAAEQLSQKIGQAIRGIFGYWTGTVSY